MDTEKRFFTGLDIGTEHIRAIILSVGKDDQISVVGYNQAKSKGMRKGVPVDLSAPGAAIDKMLIDAERMGNYDVRSAYFGIGGSSVSTTRVKSLIAFDDPEHEVNEDDLVRIEDTAIGSCPLNNREILDVIPLEYSLDDQEGIKDPLGMSGSHLELRLSVVSALAQVCENLKKIATSADIDPLGLIPNAVAAAKAVLTDEQKENGVAVVDIGAVTTSIAVYEEGDLQFVGVIPAGSQHITNDLAMILKIDLALAEDIKTHHISCDFEADRPVAIHTGTAGKNERFFERKEVEAIVRDRLDEIFAKVRSMLRSVNYDRRLPEGIILTGGGAKLRDLPIYAREALEASVRIGIPGQNLGGVADDVKTPEFATAVGLALIGATERRPSPVPAKKPKKSPKKPKKPGLFRQIFSKF